MQKLCALLLVCSVVFLHNNILSAEEESVSEPAPEVAETVEVSEPEEVERVVQEELEEMSEPEEEIKEVVEETEVEEDVTATTTESVEDEEAATSTESVPEESEEVEEIATTTEPIVIPELATTTEVLATSTVEIASSTLELATTTLEIATTTQVEVTYTPLKWNGVYTFASAEAGDLSYLVLTPLQLATITQATDLPIERMIQGRVTDDSQIEFYDSYILWSDEDSLWLYNITQDSYASVSRDPVRAQMRFTDSMGQRMEARLHHYGIEFIPVSSDGELQ